MTVTIGNPAPDFTLLDETEQKVTLSQLRGNKVILYFYPKDHTPGCTKEACDFRDHHAAFQQKGVHIFGISKDSAKTHAKFKSKHALPFQLLVDNTGDVCKAYGVINEKNLFGNTFLGIQRSTFLIDEQGIIRAIWQKVKVPGHVETIINELS